MQDETMFVIHPLDDVVEEKCSSVGLGLMELTPVVRWSLMALRVYLLAMTAVVMYCALVVADMFAHHQR